MRAIVFNTATTTLDMNFDSYPLKAAYLLCDSLLAAGEIGGNLLFEKSHKSFDLKKRIQIMDTANRWTNNEEGLRYLDSVRGSIKEYSKMKHKPREVLIAYKAIENTFLGYFQLFVADRMARLRKSGLFEMSKLVDNDILKTSLYEFSIGETIRDTNVVEANAKRVLNMVFPDDGINEPTIIVLPDHFVHNDETENESGLRKYNVEEVKEDWIRLNHCFSMPPIEGFTSLELKALRTQLREIGIQFRERLDDWIGLFKTSKTPVERQNFLMDNVLTVADKLQEALMQNDMLCQNSLKLPLDSLELQIFLGETPLKLLWSYYEKFKLLDEATVIELNRITKDNPKYPKHIPIISISPTFLNDERMAELGLDKIELEEGQPVKKNISID